MSERMSNRKLVGRRYKLIENLLLSLTEHLNTNNIVYHLEGGTLLGLVRDKKLLPWDHDIDISIPAEHIEDALPVIEEFFTKKWRVSHRFIEQSDKYFEKGALRVLKVKYKYLYLIPSYTYLDIFVKYTKGDDCCWKVHDKTMKVDKKYYQSYETIEYKGHLLKVPNLYESYLTEKYGDWHTVVKDWHFNNELTILSS